METCRYEVPLYWSKNPHGRCHQALTVLLGQHNMRLASGCERHLEVPAPRFTASPCIYFKGRGPISVYAHLIDLLTSGCSAYRLSSHNAHAHLSLAYTVREASVSMDPSTSFSSNAASNSSGHAVSVLVLVEDSQTMLGKWDDVRHRYLPALLHGLRTDNKMSPVSHCPSHRRLSH